MISRLHIGSALVVFVVFAIVFVLVEPALMIGGTTAASQFLVFQSINSEMAFVTNAGNVVLAPALGGMTGGTAVGSTQFSIRSSNSSGFTVTLQASSSDGLIGNINPANSIPAYTPATPNVPDYAFTTPAARARFGYTVEASSTSDLVQLFKDDGANCNSGSGDTVGACWLNSSTSPVTILDRNSPTDPSGATSTLKFQVVINQNPVPVIPDDTYVSTSTITATSK